VVTRFFTKGAIILRKVKNLKKAKKKKILLPIAVYVGDIEIMLFNKIVNKGDSVLEMPLKEARARRDFIVVNEMEE